MPAGKVFQPPGDVFLLAGEGILRARKEFLPSGKLILLSGEEVLAGGTELQNAQIFDDDGNGHKRHKMHKRRTTTFTTEDGVHEDAQRVGFFVRRFSEYFRRGFSKRFCMSMR